jgi:hypothetical protein
MSSQDINPQKIDPLEASTQAEAYRFPLGIFLILGPLAGIMLVLAFMSGLFEKWHPLNPPPSRPLEFAGIDVYFYQADPHVVALDGNIYLCDILPANSEQGPACAWRIEPPPLDIVQPGCQAGGIKFTGLKRPYNEIMDCAETIMGSESAPKVTYVIDGGGSLWYWAQENQGNLVFYLPLGIILGLSAGYLVALLWSPLRGIVRNSSPAFWIALGRWEIRSLRLGARLLSLLSLLYLLVRILISTRSLPLESFSAALFYFSTLLAAVGLVIAWRWEVTGGVMVLLAYLIALPSILQSADLTILISASLPYLPGVLFLLAGLLNRREQRLKSS